MAEERIKTGIDGLDEMIEGGIPINHTVVVMGSFGTGKTTFALQYIVKGLMEDENCIFISLEEDEESITKNALSYGWDLKPSIDSKKLALVKLEPSDAKNTINRIKSELPKFIKEFGAKRIVLDSVSLLNMLYDDPTEMRTQLFSLCQQIKESGATTLFTAEVKDDNPTSSRDGLVEYTVDGVILLRYSEMAESSDVQLTIRVIKMRRTRHSRKIKPYSLTDTGPVVHSESEVF